MGALGALSDAAAHFAFDVPGSTPLTVGGRPAIRYGSNMAVGYDEHTVVQIESAGLSPEELEAAAASLGPLEPSLPTPAVQPWGPHTEYDADGRALRPDPHEPAPYPCERLRLCG